MKYFFYPKRRFVTFAPIMNNNSKSPVSDLQYQQLLLRMEYEYEKEEFKRQTETMGIARKVKRGLCWYPVSPGRSYYNSLNQLVIDITRTENKEIEHSFEFGRPVCFFHQSFDGKVKYMNFIATVSYADEERMVVVLPGTGAVIELQADSSLGIQLYFDETSYRTMFEALEDTIRAKGNRLSELRDILLGTQNPGFRELYPVRFPWLNSTQETAVNKVLCTRDVAIVHGPPTIKCIEAARSGLDHTLMEKVVHKKPSAVSLLKMQYRMHESIMRFPSEWFYHGELEAAPEVRYRSILDFDTPMNWIDTSEMDFHEEFVGESFGRINKQEANLLLQELEAYINRIGKARILDEKIDFGLISPYKAQVQYLRSKIKVSSFLRPFRSLITVNTVDGFQGQERDVIFISLVRANEDGQIGFLNDLRRMNVAITRARMKLGILGDAVTLTKHPFYKRLMSFIKKEDYE